MSIFRTAVFGVFLFAAMVVPSGLSSLSINLTVVEIHDAAHESARTGQPIDFR